MKLSGSDCLCTVCKRVFKGDEAFRRHRRGKYGIDRHCIDPATVGMRLNERGRWGKPIAADTLAKLATIGRKPTPVHQGGKSARKLKTP